MIHTPAIPAQFPRSPAMRPLQGGLQFRDAAPLLCSVVDNGVCEDDPRVMLRANEATRIILNTILPVGGYAICNVPAINSILILPAWMENALEVHPLEDATRVFNNADITQNWYEIINQSTYMDPAQSMDNPLIDLGLNGNPDNPEDVRRVYHYPGLQPSNAVVQVVGAKRFVPVTHDEDFLIVQNIETLKLIILSIERYENSAPDEAAKYRQQAFELLQAEIKQHVLDPRNYMFRKAGYLQDISTFPISSLGWMRGQLALDLPDALRMGKRDLTWSINQCERRIMEHGLYKGTIAEITAEVVGGSIYMPQNVEAVLAISLDGCPIPIRSEFFQFLENGPGAFSCHAMLLDQGDQLQPGFSAPRRKYKLRAHCSEASCITAVCKLRWVLKRPEEMMTIKNYEAIRLMMTAKVLEEKEDWQNAMANQQSAYEVLDKELQHYLSGIRRTVHIQTYGFGLGDVGNYWSR